MKGCYCLVIRMDETSEIKIGKLGKIEFEKGFYVYVGSAMNSLKSRIDRHLSDDKKLHWHIDYLLKKSDICDVIYNESPRKIECELSEYLSLKTSSVKGFGCSDCECESHLYYFKNHGKAIGCVEDAYDSAAMEYKYYSLKY